MLIGWSSGTTGRPKGIMYGSDLFFKLFSEKGTGGIALQGGNSVTFFPAQVSAKVYLLCRHKILRKIKLLPKRPKNQLSSHPSQTTCFFHLGGFTIPLHTLVHGCTVFFLTPEDLDPDISLLLNAATKTESVTLLCGSHHLIQVNVNKKFK